MASILRSSKFVRYIAGFAKNIVVNTPREFDGSFVIANTTPCICGVLPRFSNFATQSSTLTDQNLESSLRRIDQDVRKSGRISRRDIEDVLEEIRNARSATSSQSLLVIRCCGNLVPEELPETRTKLVQEIWNTLNRLNVSMDISHYNALLRVYLENEYSFLPVEFLSELESKGIEPNRVTYQRLIAKYCQDGDIEGATKILEYMREKQIAVNENVFNALIIGHSKSGDMDSAQGIINVMTQAGLEPSADTYTTLLCGYANKGDIETMMKIIGECETQEIFLLDKDYLDIIFSLAINGHTGHIPAVLNKVRKAVGYNQDAINVILRLINKGYEDAAFLILKSMPRATRDDGTPVPTGNFFIRQLVRANRPLEKILEFCAKIEKEGMYENPLLLATETSLQIGNEHLVYPLLENLRDWGIKIRQHFFWPLIIAKADDPTGQEIIAVLRKMQEYHIVPNSETLREYVIPNLNGNSSEILALLREGNISVGNAASSLVVSLLYKNELGEAEAIATRVQAYYKPDLIRRPLTSAFYKTGDIKSYISILRTVYENIDRKVSTLSTEADQEADEFSDTTDKSELVGSFVLDLATNQRKFADSINEVLEELVNHGLSISGRAAEKIEEKLGEKMTDEISDLLGKLTSGELTPTPLQRKPPSYVPSHQMNVSQLERLIENLTLKNQDTKGLKRQLLTLYYRAKDLEKTEKLIEDMRQSQFLFTSGIYAQLLDLYAYHDNVEKAVEYYRKIKECEKDNFALDDMKTIRLAHILAKNDRLEEAVTILENTPRDKIPEERIFAYNALIWRFLNSMAEKGQVDELNRVFDTLLKKEYIVANNVLLGPLIKVHIVRKELDKALEKFEWCVNQYKVTPWKNDLACHLIQLEDAEKLQKLTDLSTKVHGEVNSLYDLVFAFVECGRIRQARKILETPGLQNRPQRISSVCERYRQEGHVKSLEGLKDATKDLNHIDRSDIYQQLLLSYMKQEDADKALGLWMQMQEEDLAPTDSFLSTLGEFLQKRGLEVPFVIPEDATKTTESPTLQISPQAIFRQNLRAGRTDEALKIKNSTKDPISTNDLSQLIEKLLQSDRLKEASQVCLDILNRGNFPVNRVFRFLLNKLASNGDVETLSLIGSKIGSDDKKLVSFDNRICHANVMAGRAKDYLDKLEKDVDEAGPEDMKLLSEAFPRGGAYGVLEKCPELEQQYRA
ncbi:unnamed protein product [Phaedon cochleariae]|uniref:PROP1-like PPR domain-containing protein n=1 Tax=Phaedon cochleariae TaxID=80249 RepID=A0A9P0DKP4_PHACE|nr:unnamed protein product [Phaedon cochleariae]